MNHELHLISALLTNTGENQVTVFNKILEIRNLFRTQKDKIDAIVEHYIKYKQFPSVGQVSEKYGLELPPANDATEFYVDSVKNTFLYHKMAEMYEGIGKHLKEGSQQEAAEYAQHEVLGLSDNYLVGKVVDYGKTTDSRIEDYELLQANPGIRGVKSGFSLLDQYTCGFSGGDFVILLSKSKSFKSWLLIAMALNAWLDGNDVMFYTREISAKQCFRRVDALLSGFAYRKLRYGFDNDEEFREFTRVLREKMSKHTQSKFTVFDVSGSENKAELDYIHSKVAIEKPDILFVDGVYLVQGGKGVAEWERVKNTTNRLKQMAITLDIPIVGTTQATRSAKHGKMDMEDVGGSISFAQDCDLMLAINRITDPLTEKMSNEVLVKSIASRDGGDFSSRIVLDFDVMQFEEFPTDENEIDMKAMEVEFEDPF